MNAAPEYKLVAVVKDAHALLEDVVLDLNRIERRLAQLRGRLGVAVVSYDTGAVTELPDRPDDRGPHDLRD